MEFGLVVIGVIFMGLLVTALMSPAARQARRGRGRYRRDGSWESGSGYGCSGGDGGSSGSSCGGGGGGCGGGCGGGGG